MGFLNPTQLKYKNCACHDNFFELPSSVVYLANASGHVVSIG